VGCITPAPRTTLFTPTIIATVGREVIKTAGMPARSISLIIADPQRVPEPQVEVPITPLTPLFNSSEAISLPILLQLFIAEAIPLVT
jgi:hypothetical protein